MTYPLIPSNQPTDYPTNRLLDYPTTLTNQRIYLSPPHMTGRELNYIQQTFDSNWIAPLGPQSLP